MDFTKLKTEIKTLKEQATKPLNVKALTLLDRLDNRIADYEESAKERAAKAAEKAKEKKK